MLKHIFRAQGLPYLRRTSLCSAVALLLLAIGVAPLRGQQTNSPAIIHKVRSASETMKLMVNTSRIITLDQKIAQAQVNNPDILKLTALSPNEVQVSAQAPGVTQINLWGEDKKIYAIDVVIFGDARELKMILDTQFPQSNLQVVPLLNSVMISGYVDQPEHVQRIIEVASQYYPKVLNNITVGGAQQVLLKVKVYEVSRTKLRAVGFDFAKFTGNSNMFVSGVSGLLSAVSGAAAGSNATMAFDVFSTNSEFFGVLEALRQDNLMKILAEPTLVAISGQRAFFNVGGEFPIIVPQSLGTVSIEYKKFGTEVDFVPIVLGNGRIRLEVRPRVSEIDNTRSVEVGSSTVPGLKVREVYTAVEMQAGQTLALAGLVQTRIEARNRGIPWISEVPYLGVPFRSVRDERNEVELLILVTPQLVDAMDAHEVPHCLPGMRTTQPGDWDLVMKGHLEVPNCCASCGGGGCSSCASGVPPGQLEMAPQNGVIQGGVIQNGAIQGRESVPTPKPSEMGMRVRGADNQRPLRNPQINTNPQIITRQQLPRITTPSRNPVVNQPLVGRGTVEKSGKSQGFIGPVGYDDVE